MFIFNVEVDVQVKHVYQFAQVAVNDTKTDKSSVTIGKYFVYELPMPTTAEQHFTQGLSANLTS